MKKAIITRADAGVQDWIDTTHSIIQKYADKCEADFIVLSDKSDANVINKKHINQWSRMLQIGDALDSYDRVLQLDTDVLINKDCPNIFDVVPYEKIGGVYEDKGSRQPNRRYRMKMIQDAWGDVNWTNGYINMGIWLISKPHKNIFTKVNGEIWNQDGKITGYSGEQSHFGWLTKKLGHETMDFGFKFNHMSMFSEPWNGSANRFDSHIIHYAGGGRFPDKGHLSAIQLCQRDKEIIYGKE